MRNFHLPGRSNVLSANGIAASSQSLSTLEAISILKKGGNAIDAAIAASAVQAVIEPGSTGIGGDCFALISIKNKKPISVNGSGISANKLSHIFFDEKKIKIEKTSPHSVTIPGAVHAWFSMHQRYGKIDFEELFFTAEKYARYGYPVHEVTANAWEKNIKKINNNKNSKKIFSKNGDSYKFKDIHKNIPLADTLKSISKNNIKDFYNGYIAEDIVKTLNDLGGVQTLEDFNKQDTIFSDTIKNTYKDKIIHECPPNGPGITVLVMMAILEKFDFSKINPMSSERFHIQAEAAKLAFEEREKFIGDPLFNEIEISKLISENFIDKLFSKISLKKCYEPVNFNITAHPETVYLTVVDKDLNVVSMINSICYGFGSGITTNNTGILLQNRGINFRLEKNHPNCIQGNKRPLHTIIPGLITNQNNESVMSFGVMGGQYQPVGQSHLIQNIFEFNMNIQEAIDFPRAFYLDDKYKFEKNFPNNIINDLNKLGHKTSYSDETIGGGQAIYIDKKEGVLIAGSDPRKDGCALGY